MNKALFFIIIILTYYLRTPWFCSNPLSYVLFKCFYIIYKKLTRTISGNQFIHCKFCNSTDVKSFTVSVKTVFTSFGKVDLSFHAPVSQQSVKTRTHSAIGLEFFDRREKGSTPPKKVISRPSPLPQFAAGIFDVNCPCIHVLGHDDTGSTTRLQYANGI